MGLARELVAEFDSFESRLSRFGEALFERGVAAKFRHVVIRPADGIGAEPYAHQSPSLWPESAFS
jgi:hypothetical protein